MLLHDQSHPIPTIPFSLQRGNYSHLDEGYMAGRWRGVGGDDGDDLLQFPVPAECQNGVSGPEMEFRNDGGVLDGFWRFLLTPVRF